MRISLNLLVWSVIFLCFYAYPSETYAGAWTQKPLKGQLITTTAISQAQTLIDEDGVSIDLDEFSKQESRLYLEFGLLDNLMVIGQAGYQTINFQGAGSAVAFDGFDETKLGLQYGVKQGEGYAASLSASYIIDGGLDDPRLNLGGRNDEIELRALYGRSKRLKSEEPLKWAWFYDLQFAARYDLKTDILSRAQIDLTAGIRPNERWLGMAQLYFLNIEDQTIALFETPRVLQAKTEISVARKISKNRYVQFGGLYTLAGRNALKEQGAFIGLWQAF